MNISTPAWESVGTSFTTPFPTPPPELSTKKEVEELRERVAKLEIQINMLLDMITNPGLL